METVPAHQGWTNRETYLCKLWIDEDPEALEHFQLLAKCVPTQALSEALAYYFKTESGRLQEETQAQLYTELLNHGLGLVNWKELAERVMEDAKKSS